MLTNITQILVVDDEPQMCNALRRILEREGYGVTTTSNGETAISLVKEKKPDIILLDVVMPGTDGREVCRKTRELSAETQVIYFTAKVEPIHMFKLQELRHEADAFIAKPATSKQILSKVSSVLQSASQ
jgi:CheY-like chemotaxis protein